jgi:hypothetical protein
MPDGTDTGKTGQEGTNNTPTFDDNQQKFINELFDKRFGKITSKHEEEKTALTNKVKELEDALKAAKKEGTGKEGSNNLTEAEKKQYEDLLKAEKEAAKQALKQVLEKDETVKKIQSELQQTRKTQAIRDAASSMGNGLEFHDLKLVTKLTEDAIVFDEESNQWVVKENGVIKKNNSLLPMTLTEYFESFAAERPFLVKGTVKTGAGSGEGRGNGGSGVGVVKTKADLKTVKEKSDYITKFGYDQWEALPSK